MSAPWYQERILWMVERKVRGGVHQAAEDLVSYKPWGLMWEGLTGLGYLQIRNPVREQIQEDLSQ